MLYFPGIKVPIDSDIHALSTLEDVHYATEHGVYIVNKEKVWRKIYFFYFCYLLFFFKNIVTNILYQAPVDELNKYANEDHQVPTVG